MKHSITIEVDEGLLDRYTDQQLAMIWHVAQWNPADLYDKAAGELAERIGREIITRWLRSTPPELWKHQGDHYAHGWLTRFAKYEPGSRDVSDPEWHNGTWVPRDPEEVAANLAKANGVEP